MPIVTKTFSLSTRGFTDIIDITSQVQEIIASLKTKEGQVLVFVGGSTAGITTIEYEPGLLKDLPEAFEVFAPSNKNYKHDLTWHDGNGSAHIRASILGCSINIPFQNGILTLGTWQQIVLVDFDNRPRNRQITVQVMY